MVEVTRTRFLELFNIAESFKSSLNQKLIHCEVEDSPSFVNFDYVPVDREGCPLNITIDKDPPYLLKVDIGRKIFYEEYEGQNLPDVGYLEKLIQSITKAHVSEREVFLAGRSIYYVGRVVLEGYEDIQVFKKNVFAFLESIGQEKRYTYKPWPMT